MLQNPPVILSRFSASGGILNDDRGVPPVHHGEGLLYKHHTASRGGVWRIQDKSVSRKCPFLRFHLRVVRLHLIPPVKFFKGIPVQNTGTAIPHQNHIQDGKHIHFRKDLQSQKLLCLDFHGFPRKNSGGLDVLLRINEHFVHSGDEKPGGTSGKVPHMGIHVDPCQTGQEGRHIGGRQYHIVQFVLGEAKPTVHLIKQLACKISGQADFIINPKIVNNLCENAL